MNCLTLICLVITQFLAFITKAELNIIVGKESEKEKCENCSKFTTLLEGIEASFISSSNVSLILVDEEYHLKVENFTTFLQNNKTSVFFSSSLEKQIRSLTISGRNKSFLSKIIFYDEIFSIGLRNLNFKMENIQIIFLLNFETKVTCFLCLKTKENVLSLSELYIRKVKIESKNLSIVSLNEKEFTLIDVFAESFNINLYEIDIRIEYIAFFKFFF